VTGNDVDDLREALDRVFAAEPPVRATHADVQGRAARLRRRRLAGALPAGVALALCAAVGGVVVLEATGHPVLPVAAGPSASVREGLAVKARDGLEAGAARTLTPDRGGLACAVHVLGTEPADVTAVAQARTVYVWARCATVGTEVATESSLPVAVHLTEPPTAEVPRDGALNAPDVDRIFPGRLGDVVSGGQYPELESQLRQRVLEKS
jgi:hypothetical protein